MTSQALPADFAPVPIQVQDQLWLDMDRPNNLMIIDSLTWLAAAPDWDAVRATIEDRLVNRYPVFRCRPEQMKGRTYWARDPEFRLSRHVRKAGLRGKVDEERVRKFVSDERSKPFDREHPLWSVRLIDDVVRPDGTKGAAMLLRIHHSIADGIRLTELALGLTDPIEDSTNTIAADVGAPLTRPKLTDGALGAVRSGRRTLSRVVGGLADLGTSAGSALVRDLRDPLGAPGRAAAQVGGLAVGAANELAALAGNRPDAIDLLTLVAGVAPGGKQAANTTVEALAVLKQRNPETVWSGTPGVDKNVQWATPVPLPTVRSIARATGTTINDVLLTAVAGMLMKYLAEYGEELKEVAWLLPVSLQPFGQGLPEKLGNHFALVNFRMPLDVHDPIERAREINRRTGRIKNSQETLLTFGVQRAIAQSPETVSVALTNFFANLTIGVLTNVPGPRGQVALAGTPVDAMLGWAPSSGDQPITICIYSYAGQVYLAFGVDATLIPDADRMTDLLEDEIDLLHRDLVRGDN